jgi:hypothetical protein
MDVQVDVKSRTITGNLKLTFVNRTNGALEAVPLVVYANVFRQRDSDLDDVSYPLRFPRGFSPGGLAFDEARFEGQAMHVDYAPLNGHPGALAVLRLPKGRSISPGQTAVLALRFTTTVPKRFGPFSASQKAVIALGGWYPILPAMSEEGFVSHDVRGRARVRCTVRATRPGLLVLGSRAASVGVGEELTLDRTQSSALLLYYRPEYYLTAARVAGKQSTYVVARKDFAPARQWAAEVAAVVTAALPPAGSDKRPGAFLVLEAPLREVMAMPFPGGILVSDFSFSVVPMENLLKQQKDDLAAAVFAASLLSGQEIGLFDALMAINLFQFARWFKGHSDPTFLQRVFRKAEHIGVLDKVATDPQVNFRSSMFFTPELPVEVQRSFELFASPQPSPRTAAWLLFRGMGIERVEKALAEALAAGQSVRTMLGRLATPEEKALLETAASPMAADIELHEVKRTADGWSVRICKHGLTDSVPLDLFVAGGKKAEVKTFVCEGTCCDVALADGPRRPRLQLDPHGLFLQKSPNRRQDPRRNDRNFADLKWIVSRFFLHMGGEDAIPTTGFDLILQPRYNLKNWWYLAPALTPSRVTISSGWQHGFGRMVRPGFVAFTATLVFRVTIGLFDNQGTGLGPALILTHNTRQSMTNPFEGHQASAYVLPIFSSDFQEQGLRYGGSWTQMVGRSSDHVLALRVSLDSVFGWLPDWDRSQTGGINGMRVFGATQISKRHNVGASAEYRLMLVRNLNVPLARLTYFTGLQLAAFGDAATNSDRWSGLFHEESSYVDVGAGLRFHMNFLGTVPMVISLDLAYLLPILGARQSGFNGVVSFGQPF